MKTKSINLFLIFLFFVLPLFSCQLISKNSTIPLDVNNQEVVQAEYFIQHEGWIFFSNPKDKFELYKMKSNLSEKQIVLEEIATGPFLISGNWIYYTTPGEKKFSNRLAKIQLDGSKKSVLANKLDSQIENRDQQNMSLKALVDDWLYYETMTNAGYFLYRVKIDGTNLEQISKEQAYFMRVTKDWIIYQNREDNRFLYKMKLDGTSPTKLNNFQSSSPIIDKNWVYFTNNSDKDRLYKVDINGGKSIPFSQDEFLNPIIIKGEWIYYNDLGKNGSLYKMKLDQSSTLQLLTTMSSNFSIIDDWIYYNDLIGNYSLYRVRTNGLDKEKILD